MSPFHQELRRSPRPMVLRSPLRRSISRERTTQACSPPSPMWIFGVWISTCPEGSTASNSITAPCHPCPTYMWEDVILAYRSSAAAGTLPSGDHISTTPITGSSSTALHLSLLTIWLSTGPQKGLSHTALCLSTTPGSSRTECAYRSRMIGSCR